MPRSNAPLLLLSLLPLLASAGYDKATKDAANKCCPADYMRHCMQAIEFQLRLNFRNKAAEREATICIQRELYSDDSLNVVSPKTLHCCNVFANDPTDRNNVCFNACQNASLSASIKPTRKLAIIRECRETNRQVKYFDSCRRYINGANTFKDLLMKTQLKYSCDIAKIKGPNY
ncbi:hypothetical protein PRIPAC_97584 [Pristionchus pacificus]|uniref:Uncharacterized protein n=1 Tax=Pristionchus pacificus TaxID=54126 RepID=A0A2A6CGQ3_PRIPA|nr:hypothetical protein PRIPAC_97584 [Pristionchus pacificus]|eukprot:PDM77392.1 hypothetical protein PRIPAC_33122 [Pristionchus pacificus]